MTQSPPDFSKTKAWPFEQAQAILKRLDIEKRRKIDRGDRPVVFETGYGPSGLPHIGTFGEVVRTTMVMQAFHALTDGKIPYTLICVSDDMDGMRKVPGNMPNRDMLTENLGKPLTDVPDPFEKFDSFAHHNNAKLREFLDGFGFTYEFKSATELYKNGVYDDMLIKALENFDKIMDVMLPTLGEERRQTYSPFLPISPTTGRVLYVPMKSIDPDAGTITFDDEDGTEITQPVTGGHAKLQWKPDFGMRWAALNVDFEMFGKDHQTNSKIYSRICKILGAEPPVQYVYELFLDDKGEKISKSKGNGISVEDWLSYATPESLALYMYNKPRTAKRLYFDVIPKAVDEYFQHLDAWHRQDATARLNNPVWHIHNGQPPQTGLPDGISYALLLNLVSASNASSKDILWGFIEKYAPGTNSDDFPVLDDLVAYAVKYYHDFVKPAKSYRAPDSQEQAALTDLAARLRQVGAAEQSDAEALQTLIFSVGKDHEFENLRNWFKAIYEVCLGESQGPRFGSFVAIYGCDETADLIERALAGDLG